MVEEILEALDINSSDDKQSTQDADDDVLTPRYVKQNKKRARDSLKK
jgi:hypothetical protein